MGSKMGPNYACLFVGYVEEQIGQQYTGTVPRLCNRYIGDVVGIACCSRVDLEEYIAFISNFYTALQFTHTISETELPFLSFPATANRVSHTASFYAFDASVLTRPTF